MKELAKEIRECKKCKLCEIRKNAVVGRGSMNPKVLFIGEAPGPNEDKEGIPFIGRSGQLLNVWIQALGLKEDDYAITNVVKCFPNINGKIRAPDTYEVEACRGYLDKQIELLNPKYIVTLGKFAMQYFLPDKKSIIKEAGDMHELDNGIKLFIFAHPAYFLRGNTNVKWKRMIQPCYKELNGKKLVVEGDSKLIYDIETTALDPRKGRIKRVGFWSYKYNKYIATSDLKEVSRIINDHDVIIGYNNKEFDNKWLNVHGVRTLPFTLDLYVVMKKRIALFKERFEDLKLDTVCDVLNLGRKLGVDKNIVCGENETEEEKKKLDEYLKQDIMITKGLYEYLEKRFESFKDHLSDKDVASYKHLTTSPGSFAYKAICRITGLEEIYADGHFKKVKYKGAFVKEPKDEAVKGKIFCLDFNSAYPHAYIMQNLYTKAEENETNIYSENKIYKLLGKYNTVKLGKIEQALLNIYKQRIEYKRLNDPREYGNKIISNVFYGDSGNPKFVSIFNVNTVTDCTHSVQEWIKLVIKTYEEHGYHVIYGDSDSVFILDHLDNEQKVMEIKDQIIKKIKDNMPFPQDTFDMGIDERIKAMFFFKDKKGLKEKKKHYLYITEDDRLIVKGLNVIKRNATKLSKKILRILEPQIIKNVDCRFNKSYIKKLIEEELTKDIGLAVVRFEVKDTRAYKDPNGIHATISKEFGAGIHRLVKNKMFGIGKGVKYCTEKEAKRLKFNDLDLTSVWSELEPFVKEPEVKSLNSWIKK